MTIALTIDIHTGTCTYTKGTTIALTIDIHTGTCTYTKRMTIAHTIDIHTGTCTYTKGMTIAVYSHDQQQKLSICARYCNAKCGFTMIGNAWAICFITI